MVQQAHLVLIHNIMCIVIHTHAWIIFLFGTVLVALYISLSIVYCLLHWEFLHWMRNLIVLQVLVMHLQEDYC